MCKKLLFFAACSFALTLLFHGDVCTAQVTDISLESSPQFVNNVEADVYSHGDTLKWSATFHVDCTLGTFVTAEDEEMVGTVDVDSIFVPTNSTDYPILRSEVFILPLPSPETMEACSSVSNNGNTIVADTCFSWSRN